MTGKSQNQIDLGPCGGKKPKLVDIGRNPTINSLACEGLCAQCNYAPTPWTRCGHRLDTGSPHLLVEQAENIRNAEALSTYMQLFLLNNCSHCLHSTKVLVFFTLQNTKIMKHWRTAFWGCVISFSHLRKDDLMLHFTFLHGTQQPGILTNLHLWLKTEWGQNRVKCFTKYLHVWTSFSSEQWLEIQMNNDRLKWRGNKWREREVDSYITMLVLKNKTGA